MKILLLICLILEMEKVIEFEKLFDVKLIP